MTKNELNKIDREKLLEVARGANLDVQEQRAYFKCTFGGAKNPRIYIAKTKRVTRTDLTFQLRRTGVICYNEEERKAEGLGAIQAQLDFACDEATVLEALSKACDALKALVEENQVTAAEVTETESSEPEAMIATPPEVEEDVEVTAAGAEYEVTDETDRLETIAASAEKLNQQPTV